MSYNELYKIFKLSDIHYGKYKTYINGKIKNNQITFNETETYNIELAGIFNTIDNTWVWAWSLDNNIIDDNSISKKLLNYAISINNSNNDKINALVKTILTASYIKFNNSLELSNHIGFVMNLLYNSRSILFLYKDNASNNNIINYYYVINNNNF
jgi:hypothetical protein